MASQETKMVFRVISLGTSVIRKMIAEHDLSVEAWQHAAEWVWWNLVVDLFPTQEEQEIEVVSELRAFLSAEEIAFAESRAAYHENPIGQEYLVEIGQKVYASIGRLR